jgi:hypothetical protein
MNWDGLESSLMRVLCNSSEQLRKIINNRERVANLQFEIGSEDKEIRATFLIMCQTFFFLQTVLSSNLLSENIKIKIYRTIVLAVVLYGCETWCLTLREEGRQRLFENGVLGLKGTR